MARAATVRDWTVRELGRQPYEPVWRAMQRLTDARGPDTEDELWLVEHDPVFTLGQAGKPEHVLAPGRLCYVHVATGKARVQGRELVAGDALMQWSEAGSIEIAGGPCELLLFDLPP